MSFPIIQLLTLIKSLAGDVDFDKSWQSLSDALKQIQHKNASVLSFEELYRKSYNLVLRKYGKQLYESVKDLVSLHLLSIKDSLMLKPSSTDEQKIEYLKAVANSWDDHLLSMRMISDVLMYLDRVYSKENRLPLIYDVGINLFRDNIIQFNDNFIGNKLNSLIMEQITLNRNGQVIDIFLIKSIIIMFEQIIDDDKNIELGENYYLNKFEPFYLENSLNYFNNLSMELFELNNASLYLKKINELILNEQNKSNLYLPSQTLPKLSKLINEITITSKIDKILRFSNGLKIWIKENKFIELELLYKLLSKVEYFDGLNSQIKEIILEDGELINQEIEIDDNKKNSKKIAILWIEKIIVLKDKYDLILQKFSNNVEIQKNIDKSFSIFINQNSKLSEYLSLFIDDFIKKSNDKTEEYMETIMNNSITIFRFISDKDLFEKYYKNHLAKRLLKNLNEYEKVLITKFKNEIGLNFTSKFEGMFKDINLSNEISKEFNNDKFKVNVLTKTFWPIQPSTQDIQLSEELSQLQSTFNDFYINKHNGRNLNFAYNFGSIDIRIKFDKKIHELNMSLYCGLIVLLFQNHDVLSYTEIENLTKIPKNDLIRSLQSISVAPKTRILTKSPMSKDIKINDSFKFNYAFSSPLSKIKILTVANKLETDVERNQTLIKLEDERKFELDAAIVRIMKSRKTLNHNELIIETVKQIQRFKPSPQFIKKRINELLEREYLQRDSTDKTVYHYLA